MCGYTVGWDNWLAGGALFPADSGTNSFHFPSPTPQLGKLIHIVIIGLTLGTLTYQVGRKSSLTRAAKYTPPLLPPPPPSPILHFPPVRAPSYQQPHSLFSIFSSHFSLLSIYLFPNIALSRFYPLKSLILLHLKVQLNPQ